MTKTRFTLFLSLGLLLLAASCGTKKCDSNEPPKAVYSHTDLDLGTIYYEDGPRVVDFTIRNEGGQYLHLIDVVSSCDCTKTDFDPADLVYGGDDLTIKVTFNPKDVNEGAFERLLAVYTSVKKTPDTLSFHGVIKHK